MKMRPTQWIILGLLILLVFHPVFYFKKKVNPYGILLIDRSESMGKAEKIKIDSPVDLKKISFGENEEGTDIGTALQQVAKDYEDASLTILYSDGSNTKGTNPIEVASKLEIPVYFIIPELDEMTGFISIYGPNLVREGDSVKLTAYYKVPEKAILEMNYARKAERKNIEKEGILDFYFLPPAGKNNIQFNLLIENDTIDKTNWSLDVKRTHKLLIIEEVPDWNHKFFLRYFQDIGWTVNISKRDSIAYKKLQDINIICLFDSPDKYKENIENYLKDGGNILVIGSAPINLNFLPVIAPNLTKYSGELPESYYLKPGGIRRNAKELKISGENVGYIMPFGKGIVVQFTYLELWKLALSAEQLYPENFFKKLIEDLTKELIKDEINISYSRRLLEGEDFILQFNEQINITGSFFWDGQKIPITGDSVIIGKPKKGLHHFKIESRSGIIEDSVRIMGTAPDRMGIDTLMLEGIGTMSGGGRWYKDFKKEKLGVKESEIWINLRHNWFFISLLFILLFFDWFLWMRKNN
jgi:hypothetical protein